MAIRSDRQEITGLLSAWSRGDRQALDQLMPLVTGQLRYLAQRYLKQESRPHTLQPTALVNELYLRLVGGQRIRWQDRAHFFAARIMRRILVDHARAKKTAKRGSDLQVVGIDEARDRAPAREVDVLALHDALKALAELDERQSQIVELRTFAGLTREEVAEVMGISVTTVSRDWASAKAWLYVQLAMG